jgi:polyhydroxyalkanoate synthesis regulator phasin
MVSCPPDRGGAISRKGAESMLELLRKSVLAGLGAAVITRDKVREATRLFVEEGKITTEEAEKLTEDLVKSGEKQWEDFNEKFQSSFKKFSENLEVARMKDLNELKAKVELLEQRICTLEQTRNQ